MGKKGIIRQTPSGAYFSLIFFVSTGTGVSSSSAAKSTTFAEALPIVYVGFCYLHLAASAATWPARAATNVLSPVITDISENSPLSEALRGDVMSAVEV